MTLSQKKIKGGHVVTAFAEPASGPGWANSPVWVVLRVGNALSIECLQPDEQTAEMRALYAFSALAHGQMVSAVRMSVKEQAR